MYAPAPIIAIATIVIITNTNGDIFCVFIFNVVLAMLFSVLLSSVFCKLLVFSTCAVSTTVAPALLFTFLVNTNSTSFSSPGFIVVSANPVVYSFPSAALYQF